VTTIIINRTGEVSIDAELKPGENSRWNSSGSLVKSVLQSSLAPKWAPAAHSAPCVA
jgi:hypothetical protein